MRGRPGMASTGDEVVDSSWADGQSPATILGRSPQRPSRSASTSIGRGLARSVAAGVAILVLLSVVPLGMVRLTAALPLDLTALSPSALVRPDDGALLLLLLLTVAWVSWAAVAISVAVELVAALRGASTPRLPGLRVPQRLAGALVAALLVGTVSIGGVGDSLSKPQVDLTAAVLATQPDPSADLEAPLDGRTALRPGQEEHERAAPAPQHPTIVTQRHDTLWLLAEQHLGAGERFTEIVELNEGARQPDGRALQDDGRVYPGWVLRLPSDADLDTPRPERHLVEPGDTLWEIAEEELHDPTRYPELVTENRGDLQPDGRRLTDPDLIVPGWVIALPREESPAVPGTGNDADRGPIGSASGPSDPATPPSEGADAADELDGRAGSESTADGVADRGSEEEGAAAEEALDGRAAAVQPPSEAADESRRSPDAERPGAPSGVPGRTGPGAAPERDPSSEDPSTSARPSATAPASAPEPSSTAGRRSTPARPSPPVESSSSTSARSSSAEPAASDEVSGSVDPSVTESAHPPATDPGSVLPPVSGGQRAASPPASQAEPSDGDVAQGSLGGDNRAGIALPAGGMATALVLAALAGELFRRRIQFQRWRRAGERLPLPSPGAGRLERRFADARSAGGWDALSRALETLASAGQGVRVRIVELGADSIVLHLDEAWGDDGPPSPFRRVSDRVLRAACDELEDLGAVASTMPPSGRALVTVGTREDTTVLVNLEAVGTLRLVGDDELVADVLRALAMEVALDPRHRLSTRTVCIADLRLADAAEAGDVIVDTDADRVQRAVVTALRRASGTGTGLSAARTAQGAAASELAAAVSVQAAGTGRSMPLPEETIEGAVLVQAADLIDLRDGNGEPRSAGSRVREPRPSTDGDDWTDPFEIVIADRSIGVAVLPWSGVGLISSAAMDAGVGITLAVRDAGQAVLVEDGLQLAPVGLSVASERDVVELFGATEVRRGTAVVAEQPDSPSDNSQRADDPGREAARETAGSTAILRGLSGGTMRVAGASTDADGDGPSTEVDGDGPATDAQEARPVDSEAPIGRVARVSTEPRPEGPGSQAAGGTSGRANQEQSGDVDAAAPGADVDAPAPGADHESGRAGELAGGALTAGGETASHPEQNLGSAGEQAVGPLSSRREHVVPRLLLLGAVEVENAHGRAESARIGRLAETAAFVLLHPNARPSELLAALWPGRSANPQSCRQMISRTRSWLGRTDDGEPYLEPFADTNGRLRLRPEVGSDWDDFQALARRGLADPADIDNLTAALELVRGRPFGSLWRRELAWADLVANQMLSDIVDVAYELALRHEAAGRPREARAAVHRAMRTQVESELLDELLDRLGPG